VLILGQPSSGKSTIASALLQKPIADDAKDEQQRIDFALGYDFANVRDDADEGEWPFSQARREGS
jgi:dynein light intermediate chain 1